MSVSTQQSEVLLLQTQIITWLQQQILLQPNPTTIDTKSMMDLLGQALQYQATMIELEERANKAFSLTPIRKVVISPALPSATNQDQNVAPKQAVEPSSEQEPKPDREYFSLPYAHQRAKEAGCKLTESVFRDRLRKGEVIFGWAKQAGMGSKPCYYKV